VHNARSNYGCDYLIAAVTATPLDESLIEGRVLDSVGAILPNAIVVIQHWEHISGGKSVLHSDCRVETDKDGRFSCTVPSGIYEVFASYPSMHPYANRIKVALAATTKIELTLKADPLTAYVY